MIRQDMRIGRPTGKSAKVRILRTNASKHKGLVCAAVHAGFAPVWFRDLLNVEERT